MKKQHLIRSSCLWVGLALASSAHPLLAQTAGLETTKAAAEKGDAQAEYELARCYARGIGVAQDYHQAFVLLSKAANQGYAYAQTELAACYAKGQGVELDLTNAAMWYRKAAEQGDPLAQLGLGNFYFHGRGLPQDENEAIKWWTKAAAQKLPEAQDALGQFHFRAATEGTNQPSQYPNAVKWLRLAAEQGHTASMNNLAYLYEHGLGTKLDLPEAYRWYRAAAEQGVAKAQSNLGLMCQEGNGTERDLVQAYKWFKLSAMQGDAIGRRYVEDYEDAQRLSADQLAEANRQVGEFRKQKRKEMDQTIGTK